MKEIEAEVRDIHPPFYSELNPPTQIQQRKKNEEQ
jgi:hypothetical protein